MKFPLQTNAKTKVADPVPELKPSMARAPKLKKKVNILHTSKARVGIHYDVYDPSKHNK
jgi:hypothetical protein